MSPLKTFLWFCSPLALIPIVMAWPLWLLLAIGWGIARCFRPEGVKVTERNRAKVEANVRAHRIRTVVAMKLAAEGLPNTPANRAWAITTLGQRSR